MKHRVMFVDDEKPILQGLRRSLRHLSQRYEMTFHSDSVEALRELRETPADVVISDMRMPEVDGAELLQRVAEESPRTIRVVLSGQADEETVIRSMKYTHRFLSKPCVSEAVEEVMEKTEALQSLVTCDALAQFMNGIEALPVKPHLYVELEEAISASDPCPEEIARLISSDVSMTTKILQVANSSFFGFRQNIVDVKQAIIFLGLDATRMIILSAGLFSTGKRPEEIHGMGCDRIWYHSMRVAILAQRLARELKGGSIESELVAQEALVGGLLHDVGKLILMMAEDLYRPVVKRAQSGEVTLYEAEKEMLGVSHSDVGAYLLNLWGIPLSLVEVVGFHHVPSNCPTKDLRRGALGAVHLADALVHGWERGWRVMENRYYDWELITEIGVNGSLESWVKNEVWRDQR